MTLIQDTLKELEALDVLFNNNYLTDDERKAVREAVIGDFIKSFDWLRNRKSA